MKSKIIDVCGQRFGKLLVISRANNTSRGEVQWNCQCDCGNTTVAVGRDLRLNKHKSCGCGKSESIRRGKRKEPYWWIYYKLKYIAERSGKEFDLSFEDFLSFTQITECHYCHWPVTWNPHYNKNVKYSGYNLDRRDNMKGYHKENCVVCCGTCNRVKGNEFTEEEMLRLGKVLGNIAKDRMVNICHRYGWNVPKDLQD